MDWLIDTHLGLFGLLLFLWLSSAAEIGFRWANLRRSRGRVGEREQSGAGTLITGMLALVAFTLGLTINFAQSRYEARRLNVVQEANTISTAWLRAKLIGGDEAEAVATLIADYAQVRRDYTNTESDSAGNMLLARTGDLQNRMWQTVTPLIRRMPSPVTASLVSALNDMFNAAAIQHAAFETRVPQTLMWMLLAGSSLSLGAMGYQFGLGGARQVVLTGLLLLMWVGAMLVIVDFNRPRLGSLRVDPAPLTWALDRIIAKEPLAR